MGKLTQKELLNEIAWKALMKSAGANLVRGAYKTARGAAKVGYKAGEVASNIVGLDDIYKGVTKPLVGAAKLLDKGASAVGQKAYERLTDYDRDPVAFLENKLKYEFNNVINPRTVKNIAKGNNKGNKDTFVYTFQAARMQTAANLAGTTQAASPPLETFTAVILRAPVKYIGKKPENEGKMQSIQILDANGRTVAQSGSVIDNKGAGAASSASKKPSWAEEIRDAGLPASPTFRDVKLWVLDYLPKERARLRTIFGTVKIDDILQNLMSPASNVANNMQGKIFNDATPIDAADLEALKKGLISARIFTENSQRETLKQLKVLAESLHS